MTLSLGLDILIAVLLVATIGYAAVLNKRLGSLRRHKEELERLATTFGDSTSRADDSIQRLKATTTDLQNRIEKAQALNDDLAFLIDRGTSAADRLENAVRSSRGEVDMAPRSAAKRPVEPIGIETIGDAFRGNSTFGMKDDGLGGENNDAERLRAEKELIEALRSVR